MAEKQIAIQHRRRCIDLMLKEELCVTPCCDSVNFDIIWLDWDACAKKTRMAAEAWECYKIYSIHHWRLSCQRTTFSTTVYKCYSDVILFYGVLQINVAKMTKIDLHEHQQRTTRSSDVTEKPREKSLRRKSQK